MRHFSTVQSPKMTLVGPFSPNTPILQLLGLSAIGLVKETAEANSKEPKIPNPALDSQSVGPKG